MIVKKSVYDGVPFKPHSVYSQRAAANKSTCYRLASGSLSRCSLGSVRKRSPEDEPTAQSGEAAASDCASRWPVPGNAEMWAAASAPLGGSAEKQHSLLLSFLERQTRASLSLPSTGSGPTRPDALTWWLPSEGTTYRSVQHVSPAGLGTRFAWDGGTFRKVGHSA